MSPATPVALALSAVLTAALAAVAVWPATATAVPTAALPQAPVQAGRAPEPTAVALPSLGVDATLVQVGLLSDGTLQVPGDPMVPGWYAASSRPGEPGPVVVVGHVDSRSGPGVFARLSEVQVGERVELDLADGGVAAYEVTAVRQVAKDAFPTQEVYGPVAADELRLITCGGDFDRAAGSYTDNVVVSAVRV